MTWNLEWFYDNDDGDNYSKLAKEMSAKTRAQWDWKRDVVATSIDMSRPSIIALQEIENRRVLFYLRQALQREHQLDFQEIAVESGDFFTEQDVGFMYRGNRDVDAGGSNPLRIRPTSVVTYGMTEAMENDDALSNVSKHLAVQFEIKRGDDTELVTIVTLHLRAREEAVAVRTKQARTMHAWLAKKLKAGENVIVLGDFNTEDTSWPATDGSDMSVVSGKETSDESDDLVDLHAYLANNERQTHLLPGKSFDRILVSPSLINDDPSRVDLVFTKIQQRKDLAIKGNVDVPQEHWDHYWDIDDNNRDISDHWPIMATFQWK